MFKIDLNTGNRFWTPKGLGAMGMDPHRAIAELVANSLDWRRLEKDHVLPIIQVIVTKKKIEVRDNGIGMTANELKNAIQVSVTNNKIRPNLRVRKGMFGMGMKVACLSLGWKISIHTRPISQKNVENILELNTRELDNEGITNEYRETIFGETKKHIKDGPLSNWESGTSIIIEDLTHKSLSAVAIRDSLQEVFSPEITTENVNIEVFDVTSGETYLCEKRIVPVYEGSIIQLDDLNLFVKDESTGKKVKIRGWLGLMKSGASGTGKWGLHLFKNNQIIERFHQLPIRLGGLMPKNPHPNYARTYGEVHLDMCKPAFHKVGFDYSTANWEQVQGLLAESINKVMDASSSFRVNDYEKAKQSIESIQKHKRAVKKAIAKIKKNKDVPNAPVNALVLKNGNWFTIVEPIFKTLGDNEKSKPWIYHFREESRELAIIINRDSAIYYNLIQTSTTSESLIELLITWAISDCILYLLYEKFKLSLNEAVAFRDEQLVRLTTKGEVGDE
jgi:hypothetical protein